MTAALAVSAPSARTLPGCIRSLDLRPEPRWPVALRNTRALHGVLTQVWGRPHDAREPNFLLLPWRGGCGWAAQWLVDGADSLPSRVRVHIFNAERWLMLGPPIRPKMPTPPPEGHYLLAIETVTPLLIRHGGVMRRTLEAANIVSALAQSSVIERALGRRVNVARMSLAIAHQDMRPATVHVGGTWSGCGTVIGCQGLLVVRANSYARHILELAALVGLGGRGSLGFGRIRVRELSS